VLGRITRGWARRTGLWHDTEVHCGLHDSNAALLAARAFAEIAENDATVLSTGTWFVAMRTPAPSAVVNIASLDDKRDCLVNIDAFGHLIPSSRFMGGREIELLTGIDTRRIDIRPDQPALVACVSDVLEMQASVLPTLAPGCGPYPHGRGRWISMPRDETHRRTAVCLYAALVADAALELVGARERLLIEGRFSESEVFARALASLRPNTRVYVSHARSDVSFGALRLVQPDLQPPASLVRVLPLPHNLHVYRDRWRHAAEQTERALA
jgi:sugar (pentulose or hexulose) kinase